MTKEEIIELLKDQKNNEAVEKFAAYCVRLRFEKNRQGQLKNSWMQKKTPQAMADLFKRVAADGLVFDGKHVTMQSTGVSYDYVAYKNKMLIAYPESKIDIEIVYKGDSFVFKKENGKVIYSHHVANPFEQSDNNIIGGYVVIINRRGEFLTRLSKAEFDKHRKIAKTDYIWSSWYPEMCRKTVIKKACAVHFNDLYTGIEEMDNENYDLSKSVEKTPLDLKREQVIEALDMYQGDDKQQIQELCAAKEKTREFTIEFATNILKDIS